MHETAHDKADLHWLLMKRKKEAFSLPVLDSIEFGIFRVDELMGKKS